MAIDYYYKLTGNKGKNLFNSLRQEDYDRLEEQEAEYLLMEGWPEGDRREDFINDHMWDSLNGDNLDSIVDKFPELKGKQNRDIREWLYENGSGFDEEHSIKEWAEDLAKCSMEDVGQCNHIDKNNDVDIALHFGLVRYPDRPGGIYIDDNKDTTIPAEIANEIEQLCSERNDPYKELGKEISRLERESFEKLILISGFYCTIHGGKTDFEQSIPKSEILTCPTCEHPICSECANMYAEEPDTEEKAREYIGSCAGVSGMAQCGCCGDYSEGFMLNYLKLVKCPIPEEYTATDRTPTQRDVVYVSTPSVMELQDFPDISTKVKKKFECGASGIIKVENSTGEIWGIPEKHPANWFVTICYPHER